MRDPRPAAARATAVVALLLPIAAAAAGTGVSVGAGWRGGGGFVEDASGATRSVEPSAVVSASVERAIDASRQAQLHVSVQDTAVFADAAGGGGASTRLPLRIATVHVGGTNFFQGPIGRGPYLSGGLGATLMRPGLSGTSTEAFFSMAVGVGWLWPLTPSIALRAEARGTLVAVNGEGTLFCSGGCVVSLRGEAFVQGDVQLGLAIRF